MSVLEIKNAKVRVKNETDVEEKLILDDISLSFEPKKIYVITGPNGSGKSTLAKYIMGIMPGEGQIILDGKDISSLGVVERSRRGIGFAFQTPARFKGVKVKKLMDLARGDNNRSVRRAMKNVGLCPEDYLDRNLDSTFSGGELKRIEIASVLVRDLKIAVFDEPEAGIDLWSFQRLTETFKSINRTEDTCLVIISHQERIMDLADEIIVIEKGKIVNKTSSSNFLHQISCGASCKGARECCVGGMVENAN